MSEGMFLATWARHDNVEVQVVVKAVELGMHCTCVSWGFLSSPCLTQFPAGLEQGGQCSVNTSDLGLLLFSGIAYSSEDFLSCCFPILGPGNRLSSHRTCHTKDFTFGEVLQLAIFMMWKMSSHRVLEPRGGEKKDKRV